MMLRCALPLALRPVLLLSILWAAVGCESASKSPTTPKPPVDRSASNDAPGTVQAPTARTLEIVSHVGGTHYRTVVHKGRWLQTFSNTLLVLDRERATIEARRQLCEFGSAGPAVDLAVLGERGLVVLDRDAVIEVGAESGDLVIRDTVDHVALGFRPLRVSVSGGELWVAGEGGVMRWSDRQRFLTEGVSGALGAVVASANGPIACAGRRVYEVKTGNFVAAATELLELPADAPAPLAFVLQGKETFSVGLMGSDVRELSRTMVPGTCIRIRWFDQRLWCVTDGAIHSWSVENNELVDPRLIKVRGARDVDMLGPNRLAIAGSFGRAIYRPEPQGSQRGDEFIGAVREASRLEKAIADGRRILAGSDTEGFWLYLIGAEAELSDRELSTYKQPVQSVRGVWGKAEIAEGAKSVKGISHGVEHVYTPDGNPDIYCLAAVDDCLWIGHDLGIDVVSGLAAAGGASATGGTSSASSPGAAAAPGGQPAPGGLIRIGTLRLDGPVRYIEPKWDRGAAYVAQFGGFGVARVRTERLVGGEIIDQEAIGGGVPSAAKSGSSSNRKRSTRPGDGD